MNPGRPSKKQIHSESSSRLKEMLLKTSKHYLYQELHPCLREILNDPPTPNGKQESARWRYISSKTDFRGASVIDIGANTGFFTFAALEAGAKRVTAVEGNQTHAEFVRECWQCIGQQERLEVLKKYFDFKKTRSAQYDVALCLNVLHHTGDDFGDTNISISQAKNEIADQLRRLSRLSTLAWFQIGFNWKGNPALPLFETGTKSEVIEFVNAACMNSWEVTEISAHNPESGAYEDISPRLLKRFDNSGEFLNRPLLLLRSLHQPEIFQSK